MSHSQFHSVDLFTLRHAWLNLWDKHMTTGRINQVATFKHKLRTECACIHLECMQEVLSIEKLQAEAASFTQTRSDLPMLIEARLVVFLNSADHKDRLPMKIGTVCSGWIIGGWYLSHALQQCNQLSPKCVCIRLHNVNRYTLSFLPYNSAEAGVRSEFEQIGLDWEKSWCRTLTSANSLNHVVKGHWLIGRCNDCP